MIDQKHAKELSDVLANSDFVDAKLELSKENKLFLLKEQYFVPACGEECPAFRQYMTRSKRNVGILHNNNHVPSDAVVNSVFGYAKQSCPCDKPYSCKKYSAYDTSGYV